MIDNKNEYLNNENTNPYNRNNFTKEVKLDIIKFMKYSKIIGKKIISLNDELPVQQIDPRSLINSRIKSLFHEIDSLGNYTNYEWFSHLEKNGLVRFIKELYDIWDYRANLDFEVKVNICPPYGNPFWGINMINLSSNDIEILRIFAIKIMEQLIKTGINRESRSLGSNYVLCALTLVNPVVAEALPWLYYSVAVALN